MKKYISYIILLAAGLGLGWFLFHGSGSVPKNKSAKESEAEHLWTCSMHPQILQKEPGNCPICGMELIPAETATKASINSITLTENALALANIETTKVGEVTGTGIAQILSGTIQVDEENNKVQVSYFSGRLEKLNVNYTGQTINSGQLLATIYAPELITAQQELLTAAGLKESQPGLYKAVVNKLKLWKLTDTQIQAIESTGKIKEYFPIYATVGGTVLEKMVSEGDQVKAGQPLFKISNLTTIWAVFDVYESHIAGIRKGEDISITAGAYPGEVFTAKTTFIDPLLNKGTRTSQLRAELPNTNGKWKPGMFIQGKLNHELHTSETPLLIPASAVLWTGKRSLVYVKTNPKEPVFEMRMVELGERSGTDYVVLNGLNPGEEIVTNGTFTVDAAAQLQGKPSMMNQQKKASGVQIQDYQRMQVSNTFVSQLYGVYLGYLHLKSALIQDDFTMAEASLKNFESHLDNVDMALLQKPEAHETWMPAKQTIKTAINKIKGAKNIGEQRRIFSEISNQMIVLVETFGIKEKVYVQFCPMAGENTGSFWLSSTDEIENPYFGDAMLTCGNVVKTIE